LHEAPAKLSFRLETPYCTVLYDVLFNALSVTKVMQYQGQTNKGAWSIGGLIGEKTAVLGGNLS
jgi:hypothetical protein